MNTSSAEWQKIFDIRLNLIQSAQNIAEFIGRKPPLKMPVVHQFSSKIRGCLFFFWYEVVYCKVSLVILVFRRSIITVIFLRLKMWLYRVMCSTNGTYLNWERLKKNSQEAKICHGDIISLAAAPQHGCLNFHFSTMWLYLHLVDIALPISILF